jgi:hypothetical protein
VSHPISLTFTLILSCYLNLFLPSGLFPSHIAVRIVYPLLILPMHVIGNAPFGLVTIIFGGKYKLCSSALCNYLHPPVTSFLSGSNIFLSTPFSYIVNLCSSLRMSYQVLQPYKIISFTHKYIVRVYAYLCKNITEIMLKIYFRKGTL